MPTVSVVMASYNHAQYIGQAIEGVLGQTFSDLELIIIDDGSKDVSQEIIKTYARKDSRVQYVFHAFNQGIAQTVNDGLERARGLYVGLTSSDDVWLPSKLEKQIAVLKEDPDVIVWTNGGLIDECGNHLDGDFFKYARKRHENLKLSGNIFLDLVAGNYIASQSLLFSHKVLEKHRFNKKFKYLNDYIFCLDLASNYDYHFIDENLFYYRRHRSNTTSNQSLRWVRDGVLAYVYIAKNYNSRLPVTARAKNYFILAKLLEKLNHQKLAKKYYYRAWTSWPFKKKYRSALWRVYRRTKFL